MDTLKIILDPDFLLKYSVYTSLLIGLGCPIIGVFLVLRRLIFLGVALPQISATGVAISLSIPLLFGMEALDSGSEHLWGLIGAVGLSLSSIVVFALLDRQRKGIPEGRLGTAYAVASAVSILLLSKNALAELGWMDMMKGEIVSVSRMDCAITAIVFAVILILVTVFNKELLLVSYDRTMAVTLHKNVVLWDLMIYLLIGLAVSSSVMSVGPIVTFGFLVIPVLAAHLIASNMKWLFWLASLIGGTASLVGFALAYQFDYPVGSMDVVLLGLMYLLLQGMNQLRKALTHRKQPSIHGG